MLKYVLGSFLILLSTVSIVAAAGIFSPGLLLTITLMIICGVVAAFGRLKLAVVCIALNSIAFALSPVSNLERYHEGIIPWLCLLSVIIGFAGLYLGIYRQQRAHC